MKNRNYQFGFHFGHRQLGYGPAAPALTLGLYAGTICPSKEGFTQSAF